MELTLYRRPTETENEFYKRIQNNEDKLFPQSVSITKTEATLYYFESSI